MSNYNFLIEKNENVEKYPFLKVLYDECILNENLSFINENLMYSKCSFILEEVVNYYTKFKNIDKNKMGKKDGINNPYTILLKRDFNVNNNEEYYIINNLYSNKLNSSWTLDKNSKTYRTLYNLRKFIIWFYNELCNENIEDTGFNTSNIDIISILDIKCIKAAETLVNYKEDIKVINESKIKKLIKKPKTYEFVFNEDSIVIVNNKKAIFEIFRNSDNISVKNNEYYNNVLINVKNEIDFLKTEFKTIQKDILKIQERNIQAVESFEKYCDIFDVKDRKKVLLLDKIEEVRKEENKLLSNIIDEMEKCIFDKSETLKFLNKSLKDKESSNVFYEIDELDLYVRIIKDIFKDFNIYNEYDFLCEKVKKINNAYEKTDFNNEGKSRNYSSEELKNLFCILKARYNELIFKYESERIITEKIERDSKEYEEDILELKKSLNNKNEELKEVNNKLSKIISKKNKFIKCYGGIVIIFVLMILFLVLKNYFI